MTPQQRHDTISDKLTRALHMSGFEQEQLKQTLHYLEVECGAKPRNNTKPSHTHKCTSTHSKKP